MEDIFSLSDAAVDQLAAADPMSATYAGISGFDHLWTDLSPEGAEESKRLHQELRDKANACPTPDARHILAQRVLTDYCDETLHFLEAGDHLRDLNSIASPHQGLRMIYGSMGDQTTEDWEAITERLHGTVDALDGFQKSLDLGRSEGGTVSRRQIHEVLTQGESAVGAVSSFAALRRRFAESPVESESLARRLEDGILAAQSAFASFNTYLAEQYLPDAAESDAVGESRYLRAAERFLGTELDARETYRWGWDEVERLYGELTTACAQIDPDRTVEDVLEELTTSPKYAAADVDDFINQMVDRQHHALASLEGVHFDVPEEIRRIDVQVEPAGGSLAAHYVGPSEDFSRAGSVWYPVDGQEHFPLFAEVTTAYHEGFPGHHLQVGVQATLRDELSRFHRRFVWYPGSGEGWALYAEHLMGELGYLERPEYVIGLLTSQLLRASRVAIDIGVHLDLSIPDDVSFHPGEKWSYALAKEMLRQRAFLNEATATSETLRYLGWPGQAISYKVGERAILDLRSEWESALGDTFDPKTFHSTVLGVGSVGLDLLVDRVSAELSVLARSSD